MALCLLLLSSAFKAKFHALKLGAIDCQAIIHAPTGASAVAAAAQAAAAAAATVAASKPKNPPLPLAEFESVLPTWKELKWRIIPKPGGATMKPDIWYHMNGEPSRSRFSPGPDGSSPCCGGCGIDRGSIYCRRAPHPQDLFFARRPAPVREGGLHRGEADVGRHRGPRLQRA